MSHRCELTAAVGTLHRARNSCEPAPEGVDRPYARVQPAADRHPAQADGLRQVLPGFGVVVHVVRDRPMQAKA